MVRCRECGAPAGDTQSTKTSADSLRTTDEEQSVSIADELQTTSTGSELLSAADLEQLESVDAEELPEQHPRPRATTMSAATPADAQDVDATADGASMKGRSLPIREMQGRATDSTERAVSDRVAVDRRQKQSSRAPVRDVLPESGRLTARVFVPESASGRLIVAATCAIGLGCWWWLTRLAPQLPPVETSNQTFDADKPTSVTLKAMLHKTALNHNGRRWLLFPLSKAVLEECTERDGQGNQTAIVSVETKREGPTQLRAKIKLTFKLTNVEKAADRLLKAEYDLRSVETISATTFQSESGSD